MLPSVVIVTRSSCYPWLSYLLIVSTEHKQCMYMVGGREVGGDTYEHRASARARAGAGASGLRAGARASLWLGLGLGLGL